MILNHDEEGRDKVRRFCSGNHEDISDQSEEVELLFLQHKAFSLLVAFSIHSAMISLILFTWFAV